jgi:hypothetical protein
MQAKSSSQRAPEMTEQLGLAPLPDPEFLAGDVAKILRVPVPRLQKFVKRFELEPKQLGSGPGSRRVFSKLDVYRIGVAARLFTDGFVQSFIATVLEYASDDLLRGEDSEGNARPMGIVFRRGEKSPEIGSFKSSDPPPVTPATPEYYVLDIDALTREIDRRIGTMQSSN